MPRSSLSREEIRSFAQLSPFELKDKFIAIATAAQSGSPGQKGRTTRAMLNA